MGEPQLELEQVGRKWRVIRTDVDPRWSVCSPLVSRKEAEWFLNQLQRPTETATDEWVDIKIEAEQEDYQHKLAQDRPFKLRWIRKERAEGRQPRPPYRPEMTKKRYLKLLELARQEEEARTKGEPS